MRRTHAEVAVLVSGGIESASMLAGMKRRGRRIQPVYVREGHAWERAELYWLPRLIRALQLPPAAVLDMPMSDTYLPGHWSLSGRAPSARSRDEAVYLPGKNILLLAKAAVFSAQRGIGAIALGTLGSNPFPDAGSAFFRLMQRALSEGLGTPLRLERPFSALHKRDVLLRFPRMPWQLTFSCISPRGWLHCGRCNKCAERKKAFLDAGLTDPTRYRA